jgi:hypothetical protein
VRRLTRSSLEALPPRLFIGQNIAEYTENP